MMPNREYGIRKSFMIPFLLDVVFVGALFIISLFRRSFGAEPVLLALIFTAMLTYLLVSAFRKAVLSEDGLAIGGLVKKKKLQWDDITNVDALVMGKKAFLLLTTTKGFHVLSNSYENFVGMVEEIKSNMPEDRIEEKVSVLIEKPVRKISDVAGAWIAAFLIALICIVKMG